jgi:hypothetical protein
MSAPADWFDMEPEKPSINDALAKAAKAPSKPKAEDFDLTPPEPVDDILASIASAKDDDLDIWLEEAGKQGLTDADLARVEAAIEARRARA